MHVASFPLFVFFISLIELSLFKYILIFNFGFAAMEIKIFPQKQNAQLNE